MSAHFDTYKNGWSQGDLDMILSACADDFVLDDPIDGTITKAEFPDYFKTQAAVEVTEVVTEESEGIETAWCWWKTSKQEGAALAKVGPDGVHWQRVTYFAREPLISRAQSGTAQR